MDKDLTSAIEEMDRLIPKHYDQVVFSRRADGEIDGQADWDDWGRPRIRITAKTLPEAMFELVLALKGTPSSGPVSPRLRTGCGKGRGL